MSVLVCFALKEEAAPFRKIAGGLRNSHQVSILLTGIGRRNAGKSLRELLESAATSGAAVDASSSAAANNGASFATREARVLPSLS